MQYPLRISKERLRAAIEALGDIVPHQRQVHRMHHILVIVWERCPVYWLHKRFHLEYEERRFNIDYGYFCGVLLG